MYNQSDACFCTTKTSEEDIRVKVREIMVEDIKEMTEVFNRYFHSLLTKENDLGKKE